MMRHRARRNRRLLPLSVLGLLAAAATADGCAPGTRYRVLSAVFDGVPPPEPPETAAAAEGRAPEAEGAALAAGKEGSPRPSLVVHPPFAEKRCELCHELEPGRRFAGAASLRVPQRELCAGCHEAMALRSLKEHYGWVHGPVAAGACTGCHSPHRSSHEKLLLAAADGSLCLRCHDRERLASTETHEEVGGECFDCHQAHGEDEAWWR